MKILADANMPYGADFFADWSDFSTFEHTSLSAEQLVDVDVLLVRSTVKVDPSLLKYADKLRFVGTATSGSNHVDKTYLKDKGIPFASAKGCNAIAVAEYVLCAMLETAERSGWSVFERSVGIVGAGNVGSALAAKLEALGIEYQLCDPPLKHAGDPRDFVDMQAILACDTISLHVPLVDGGEHPTRHLLGLEQLQNLNEQQLLINACRGEVVDNQALLDVCLQGKVMNLVLDVWDNEPDILWPLVEHAHIATPHIAGHSLEGKARGTSMLYDALTQVLQRPNTKTLPDFLPDAQLQTLPSLSSSLDKSLSSQRDLLALCRCFYDIRRDDRAFREQVKNADAFIQSRKTYGIRREFDAAPISTGNPGNSQALFGLGFQPT